MTERYLATAVERRAIHQFVELARCEGFQLRYVTGDELTVFQVSALIDRQLGINRERLNYERAAESFHRLDEAVRAK